MNSLSQVLIKLVSPGVPDLYQGNELFEFRLVDPDNRQPVDYALRQKLLYELLSLPHPECKSKAREIAKELFQGSDHTKRLKLFLTWRGLQARQQYAELFSTGEYVPLSVEG